MYHEQGKWVYGNSVHSAQLFLEVSNYSKKSITFFNVDSWFRSRISSRVFNSSGKGGKSSATQGQ